MITFYFVKINPDGQDKEIGHLHDEYLERGNNFCWSISPIEFVDHLLAYPVTQLHIIRSDELLATDAITDDKYYKLYSYDTFLKEIYATIDKTSDDNAISRQSECS